MARRLASVVPLNDKAIDGNWRMVVGQVLAEKNVRGVAIVTFYRDGDYVTTWSGVRRSSLALAGARLLRCATDGE